MFSDFQDGANFRPEALPADVAVPSILHLRIYSMPSIDSFQLISAEILVTVLPLNVKTVSRMSIES